MKKITRVRVTERMARVVRFINNGSAKSAPEVFKQTKAFPSLSATSVCLWSMAKLGVLVRKKRRNGNGETPFFLSDDMVKAMNGETVDDRRIMEIVRIINRIEGKKDSGGFTLQ